MKKEKEKAGCVKFKQPAIKLSRNLNHSILERIVFDTDGYYFFTDIKKRRM